MSAIVPLSGLCSCGRPAGHTGRHVGSTLVKKAPRPARAAADDKLLKWVEKDIARVAAERVALKQAVRAKQDQLVSIETRLVALQAFRDGLAASAVAPVSSHPDILPPDPKPATVLAGVMVSPPPPPPPLPVKPKASFAAPLPDKPKASFAAPHIIDEDYAPVAVTFSKVSAWAMVRKLKFSSWDDLPAINARREAFELPPFKRAF